MTLTRVKNQNAYVLTQGNDEILFSYQTPVACVLRENHNLRGAFKDTEFHSVTTSKHINQFLRERGFDPKTVLTINMKMVADQRVPAGIVLPEVVARR